MGDHRPPKQGAYYRDEDDDDEDDSNAIHQLASSSKQVGMKKSIKTKKSYNEEHEPEHDLSSESAFTHLNTTIPAASKPSSSSKKTPSNGNRAIQPPNTPASSSSARMLLDNDEDSGPPFPSATILHSSKTNPATTTPSSASKSTVKRQMTSTATTATRKQQPTQSRSNSSRGDGKIQSNRESLQRSMTVTGAYQHKTMMDPEVMQDEDVEDDEGLPEGWARYFDKNYKRYYYENLADGTVTWDHPRDIIMQQQQQNQQFMLSQYQQMQNMQRYQNEAYQAYVMKQHYADAVQQQELELQQQLLYLQQQQQQQQQRRAHEKSAKVLVASGSKDPRKMTDSELDAFLYDPKNNATPQSRMDSFKSDSDLLKNKADPRGSNGSSIELDLRKPYTGSPSPLVDGDTRPKKSLPITPPTPQPPRKPGYLEIRDHRRFCGCFRTRRGCGLTICLIVFLILAGLGLAVFFLWPRIPSVTVSQPFVMDGIAPFQQSGTGTLATASPSNPAIYQFNLGISVNVLSSNFEDVKVSNVWLNGNLLDAQGNTLSDASAAGLAQNLLFRNGVNTTFTIPISLTHRITTSGNLASIVQSDRTLSTIANSCGLINTNTVSDFMMSYTVLIYVDLISWTGYKPSFSGTVNFPCPIPAGSITSIKL